MPYYQKIPIIKSSLLEEVYEAVGLWRCWTMSMVCCTMTMVCCTMTMVCYRVDSVSHYCDVGIVWLLTILCDAYYCDVGIVWLVVMQRCDSGIVWLWQSCAMQPRSVYENVLYLCWSYGLLDATEELNNEHNFYSTLLDLTLLRIFIDMVFGNSYHRVPSF